MAWTNNYKPPPPLDPSTSWGPEPYDTNFVFPIHPSTLENDLVKLTPFVPRLHAQAYFDASTPHADALYRFMPLPPVTALDEFLLFIEGGFRRDPGCVLFAILDKTEAGARFAGIVGVLHTDARHLSTEIGPVVVLPEFQRTHVTRNAVGLVLHWCLDIPAAAKPGLGLRRVQWMAHEGNVASRKTALRMGFKMEGLLRWDKVLPVGREGKEARASDPKHECKGRDSVLLAMCWDDWENGGREHVDTLMANN